MNENVYLLILIIFNIKCNIDFILQFFVTL